jgi:GTP-binding protein HflX
LIGAGWVQRLQQDLTHMKVELLYVNTEVTPLQQRNLEHALKCSVLDRPGLILKIFADRARSAAGKLQVQLAQLSYQRSRLVGTWTHLERQRGGGLFTAGPGESQLELDRRMLEEKISRLKKRLHQVKKTRLLGRQARLKKGLPTVALVGYTNAGKSTLFNQLTREKVLTSNQLFATLDPILRQAHLPNGRQAIFSDTVGFIGNLPTLLVEAFHSTLEEVVEAQLILHVRDMSHPEAAQQKRDVDQVLEKLNSKAVAEGQIIEVWNKVDCLSCEERDKLYAIAQRQSPSPSIISAKEGTGCIELLKAIESTLYPRDLHIKIELNLEAAETLGWLYTHCRVLGIQEGKSDMLIDAIVNPEILLKLRHLPGLNVV